MSNTRINNDEGRISLRLNQSTAQGNWIINPPGNGSKPCYTSDPYLRIQKWGANVRTNFTDLESQLKGVNRNLGRDCKRDVYKSYDVDSDAIAYPTCDDLTTKQPRSSNPAWTLREIESYPTNFLFLNPQENCAFAFQNNLCTRIIEKDNFKSLSN